MIIRIDTDYIDISVLQFLYLEQLYLGKDLGVKLTEEEIALLEELGYLFKSKLALKFVSKYKVESGGAFIEFEKIFPTRSPEGRLLSTNRSECVKLYNKAINNDRTLHKLILDCLEYELAEREKAGSVEFMYGMPRWIKSRYWENYIDSVKENAVINNDNEFDMLL